MPRGPHTTQDENEDVFFRPQREKAEGATPSRRRSAVALEEPDEDLDAVGDEEDSPFLRAKKRPPVRKAGPKKTARRVLIGGAIALVLVIVGLTAFTIDRYVAHDGHFRLDSSDNIETGSLKQVSRTQVLDVFGADIGRNILFVPLAERKRQLEQVPWIQSATVMRFMPNHIRVEIRERQPVAFAEVGGRVALIDASGVVMDVPHGEKFDFPVITGFSAADPLSVRTARMKIYTRMIADLDGTGAHYSADLSEVNLSDPEDVRVTTTDANGPVLIHFGDSDFARRYKFYLEHINAWRQQYAVRSVDLRYDGQVIVNREGQTR